MTIPEIPGSGPDFYNMQDVPHFEIDTEPPDRSFSRMPDALSEYVANQYNDFQYGLEHAKIEKKYLNYGYVRGAQKSIESKQEELCLVVFEAAGVKPEHVIVDVGFGSGEQDFLFAERFQFKKLYGYNIAASQVQYATDRARAAGLSEKLIFRHGPAESMSEVPDASVDRVLSVECAFYFDRPRFYREAARILRPGGKLVLADITFSDRIAFLIRASQDLRRVSHISRNRKDWEEYFHTARIQSINKNTIPGSQQTVFVLLGIIARNFQFSRLRSWMTVFKMALSSQITNLGFRTRLIHYDLIVLEKK